ncbi:hypothetical protein [Streptomyces variegatus]|uniref:hypothetical protein n=1 Tax=Streptomyces variegatus TaxID=284040 RepID=UPI003C2D1DF8
MSYPREAVRWNLPLPLPLPLPVPVLLLKGGLPGCSPPSGGARAAGKSRFVPLRCKAGQDSA